MSKKLTDKIIETLQGDAQKNALDFANFLMANQITQRSTDGAWCSGDKALFYMHIDGTESMPGPWTIWLDGDYSSTDISLDETVKEIAWANVNPCGNCGSGCNPGTTQTIFGKKFAEICNSALAFTNPDASTLEGVKKLIEVRVA